jgi:hypothetical protein
MKAIIPPESWNATGTFFTAMNLANSWDSVSFSDLIKTPPSKCKFVLIMLHKVVLS